jgi:Na+-driven multidrug efflux pump
MGSSSTRRETERPLLSQAPELTALGGFELAQPLVQESGSRSRTSVEAGLLWALTWPLFFQTLANEISMVVTTALYGHLGDTDLAAANDTMSMIWFAMVFVGGAQNVVYTMAPQAKGAGSRQQVGVILQLTLFWTCVVLAPPTAFFVYCMGDVLIALDLIEEPDGGGGSGSGSDSSAWAVDANGDDEKAAVVSFAHGSALWVVPYILATSVTTWLD